MVKEYTINENKIIIQEGDCFLVRNKKIHNVGTFLGYLIRGVISSRYNHFSIVVKYNEDLWILEAIGRGVIITHKLDDYIFDTRRELKVLDRNINLVVFREGVDIITGKKYDVFSLLVLQFIRVMLAKIGIKFKTKKKGADRKLFCTEAGGIVMGIENWYEMTPKDFDIMFGAKYIIHEDEKFLKNKIINDINDDIE